MERSKVVRSAGATKPPAAGRGRAKGTPNKTTAVLKEAILLAAAQVGRDGRGKDGLTGYLRRVAITDIRAFAGLLGKVLPMQVEGPGGGPVAIERTYVVDPRVQALVKDLLDKV
jgi:hypothetical protein